MYRQNDFEAVILTLLKLHNVAFNADVSPFNWFNIKSHWRASWLINLYDQIEETN